MKKKSGQPEPVDFVNPNIGGMAHLLIPTLPLVHLPNSMMRLAKQPQGYDHEKISYFPINIVSHRVGTVGRLMVTCGETNTRTDSWSSDYDHNFEEATPCAYSVLLEQYDINASFTTSEHAVLYHFSPGREEQLNLFIQTQREGSLKFIPEKNIIEGHEIISGVKVFFHVKTDQQPDQYGSFTAHERFENQDLIDGEQPGIFVSFNPRKNFQLKVKLAVSYISTDQAERHMVREIPAWDLEEIIQAGRQKWNRNLGKIKVTGGSEDNQTTFYTALYRCMERMVNVSEEGRYYSHYDHEVHEDDGIDFYVDDWSWDTYRAQHPLQILIDPQEQVKKINAYIRFYEQSGWVPRFPLVMGEAAYMNGNHPAAIITDAYIKGLRGFDIEKAYEGLRKTELERTMLPWRTGPLTTLDKFYHQHGFYPALKTDQEEWVTEVDSLEKRQAVSLTLAYSYDDWCLAVLARELGKKEEYQFFRKRAENYKNLFEPASGFFAPRDADGKWVRPFDPKLGGGFGGRDYFAENNAWTYLFDVQHDIASLISLLGGKDKFIAKLDALFTEDCGTRKSNYLAQFPDATGLVGQFAMGNEPGLHIPYLYNYAGSAWKTQKRIRMLMDLWFTNSPFGICGDEDGGGLSSFYVFSAMGFYPVTPGTPYYTIGSPLFSQIEIELGKNKFFIVEAHNNSKRNKYIQKAQLNGRNLTVPFFSHHDISDGGLLKLEMGPRPNPDWGKGSDGPYSLKNDKG